MKVLAFDLETVAAGYADPDWVPHTVTAWAYSWGDTIRSSVLPPRHLYDNLVRRRFLAPLIDQINQATMVSGHNLVRFDLPVLNAELMRLGMRPLAPIQVLDTMRVPKAKGFKKGQDNLAVLLRVPEPKKHLNWQEWQDAYSDPTLATVRERVESDVRQHLQVREAMRANGWLKPPRTWKP